MEQGGWTMGPGQAGRQGHEGAAHPEAGAQGLVPGIHGRRQTQLDLLPVLAERFPGMGVDEAQARGGNTGLGKLPGNVGPGTVAQVPQIQE